MIYNSTYITRNAAASLIAYKLISNNTPIMRLHEVCSQITDGEHQTPLRQLSGIPLLTAKNIRDGFIDLTDTDFVSYETAEKCWKRCKIQQSDILMACVGTIGRATVVREGIDAVIVRSVALLRPRHDIVHPDYLEGLLYSLSVRKQMLELIRRSAQPGIYLSQIKTLEIPLPELDIQRSVVEFLSWCLSPGRSVTQPPPLSGIMEDVRPVIARIDKLAARIEEARGLRREAVEETVKLWESSLRAMFEQLAKDYQHKTFREVCNVVRGGSPRPAGDPTYYDGSIPFLKVADLTADTHKYVTTYSATIKEAGLSHSRYVESNTLMLTNSGATLGVPKICTFGTCFNDGVQAFLNIPNNIAKEYLYYFLLSKTRWFRKWAARGQGQPNLNTEMVKGMEFPLPPLAEQCHIVAYLDDLRSKADILGHLQSETSAELDALLPSILDKAFKGEL